MILLLVGLGGAAGAMARYWLSTLAQGAAAGTALAGFPLGTLLVNALGCFAIGVLSELADRRGFMTPEARALLVVGVLGGFTTFSTFATETVNAWRAGMALVAGSNALVSVATCLAAVWAGRGALTVLLK